MPGTSVLNAFIRVLNINFLICVLLVLSPAYGIAQNDGFLSANTANIRSIRLHPENDPGGLPVFVPSEGIELVLHFDDLYDKVEPFHYRITHLHPDGNPSDLNPYEYHTGFEVNPISDYRFSVNTHLDYIHYQLKLPNRDVQLLLSGKYALEVYASAMDEEALFRRVFYVAEQAATASLTVRPSTIPDHQRSHQEVDLSIKTNEVLIDPYRRLSIALYQNNNRWTKMENIQPNYVNGRDLVFQSNPIIEMEGGNEYRFFNCNDHRFKASGVYEISFLDGLFHFYLEPGMNRQFKRFESYADFEGRYRIDNAHARDVEIEADYVMVHFSLLADAPWVQESVYVYGELSDWDLKEEYKMEYNLRTKRYEKELLLKQGYYNYSYVLQNELTGEVDFNRLEGNHSQTTNSYQLFVYYGESPRFYRLLYVHSFPEIKPSGVSRE